MSKTKAKGKIKMSDKKVREIIPLDPNDYDGSKNRHITSSACGGFSEYSCLSDDDDYYIMD